MSDLISRADAIEAISKHGDLPFAWWKTICRELQDLPSADAVQGEWVDEDGNNVPLHKDGYPLRSCYCNQCHEWLIASDEYEVKGNFCPNCGARMKGGAEE